MRRGLAALLALTAAAAAAEERIADIRQGTNVSVALAPNGTSLVVDVLGQLWTLPATGGGAMPLTSAGEHARNPRFSPDGQRVVYQRRDGDDWDVWLLELATGEARPLVASPSDEREPDFTHDGTAVVFASNRTGHYGLWSVTIDGGVETQLTEESGTASYPSASEHGLIAYVLARNGEWSVRVLGNGGVISVVHTSSSRLSAPTWRPGGGVLVFGEQDSAETSRLQMLLLGEPRVLKSLSRGEDVFPSRAAWRSGAEFIYAADGQLWRRGIASPAREPVHLFAAAAVEVATPPADLPPFDAPGPRSAVGVNGVARSPDGRRTAFTALGDLWLVERGEPRRLTDDALVDLDPAFWPDGESLVFASERTGQFELWRLALRDGSFTQLTFGALEPRHPAVHPDGNSIAYFERAGLEPGAATALKTLDWRRREETTIADDVLDAAALSWSEDGRALAVRGRSASATNARNFRVEFRMDAPTAAAPAAETAPQVRWEPPPAPRAYVVEIGRLFDGVRGTYQRHVDLHVRDGRIAAIVPRGTLPAIGEVRDARDATVIPGLIDLHAHQSSLIGERLGRAWLAYGVTTVRELTAAPGEAAERAETWASGRAPGPRLLISGPETPGVAAPTLRAYPGIANGFAHSLQRQSREIAVPAWPASTFPARLRAGPAPAGRELELSPGFTAYQDGFSRLIASDTVFVTGLAALAGLHGWPTPRPRANGAFTALFTPTEQAAWERPDTLASAVPALERTIARLVRAGGQVGVGSDAPAVPYGLGVHLELALLARAGIANDQVLRMATAGGALALGVEQQVGTLEVGKLADFVVIDGDPLAHIGDALRIVAVATGGVWHEHAALLESP